MKIGIDARLYTESGIGRYVRNLILELENIDSQNDFIIFVNKKGSELYHPKNTRFKKWIVDIPVYSMEEQTVLLPEYMRARLDVLHVPHFNVPIFYRKPLIVTIHDLTMSENDPSATNQTDTMYKLKFAAQKIALKRAISKSKYLITPSESTKKEIVAKYGVNESKIHVTYEGVDNHFIQSGQSDMGNLKTKLEKYPLKRDYLLYVGSVYPHKNLNNFLVAYKAAIESGKTNLQIVIAGKADIFMQRLAAYVKGLNIHQHVIFASKYHETGFVDDTELAYLYTGAFGYVIPSKKEGFSITPLEAQAAGVPVLCSDIPVHKEILGDSAVYFNPESNIDMMGKLIEFEKDQTLRSTLIEKGLKNTQKYSWRKMAEETINLYLHT